MGQLRAFIAADIPSSIRQAIQGQVGHLRKTIGDFSVRWVAANNLHLSLKFLGNINSSDVDGFIQIIRAEAEIYPPLDIVIKGLGSFPNSKRARVLFIGIQPPAELDALYRGIESACAKLGYEPESRPFAPHLTIGRVRETVTSADRDKIYKTLEETKIDSLGIARVDSIHLYKSDLKPTGAVYTKLFSAPLSKR